MKKTLSTIVAVLVLVLTGHPLAQESKEEPVKIKVPERTVIPVKLLQHLKGAALAVGQSIDFEVSMDIIIDRYVVIKRGAPAYATVTTAQKAGYVSQGGKLGFSMDHCKAVDGSRVYLKSVIGREAEDQMGANIAASILICPLFLAMKGEEAELAVGSEFKAYTASEVTVAVLPGERVPVEEPKVASVPPETKPEVIDRIKLRDRAEKDFNDQDLQNMIKERNFFNRQYNPGGSFPNAFVDNGDGTITDKVTGLMWQKGGSPSEIPFYDAGKYLEELNSSRFGGYGDWRLPTMEELCSLLEGTPNKSGKFMENFFDPTQSICWSADENQRYSGTRVPFAVKIAFSVGFTRGETSAGIATKVHNYENLYYVRAVRTAE
jgi:hypothetical protein